MIQKRLLCHSAKLYSVTVSDWGAETEVLRSSLSQIRIEPVEEMVKTETGTDVRSSAVLFFDLTNSTGDVPAVGNVVKVNEGAANERRYRVVKVEEMYGATALHHVEVKLSDG